MFLLSINESRSNAVTSLLSDVNWDGSTPYGQELGELRVHQLNKELSITSELIDQVIILASGGYNTGASGGGGGSDNNDRFSRYFQGATGASLLPVLLSRIGLAISVPVLPISDAVHCNRSCSALHLSLQCTAGKELCFCSLSFACIHLFPFDICLIKVPVFLPF